MTHSRLRDAHSLVEDRIAGGIVNYWSYFDQLAIQTAQGAIDRIDQGRKMALIWEIF